MISVLDTDRVALVQGDCLEVLRGLEENSIDAVVTDPPYELGFMGKKWDATGIAYSVELWREVLRVLKPGGHLLAFGGTRTYHRMTCAIEDAGFEIRDCVAWMYGTGFPKSLNVGKAIDEAAGATREVVGQRNPFADGKLRRTADKASGVDFVSEKHLKNGLVDVTAPATEAAAQWEGWGTALKPAHEPIVLARKPLTGTVAANVQEWGTGGLNIDGCRIEGAYETRDRNTEGGASMFGMGAGGGAFVPTEGRWPANVTLDEEAAALLDAQSGERGAAAPVKGTEPSAAVEPGTITGARKRVPGAFHADSGGASRFFYTAKPSRKERDLGCEHLPAKTGGEATDREDGSAGTQNPRAGAGRTGGAKNFHPTVKPIALMRWLVRLVTPPGGTVLDPFTGSGTTGIAALQEGFNFLGIEREAEYAEIAKARIGAAESDPAPTQEVA